MDSYCEFAPNVRVPVALKSEVTGENSSGILIFSAHVTSAIRRAVGKYYLAVVGTSVNTDLYMRVDDFHPPLMLANIDNKLWFLLLQDFQVYFKTRQEQSLNFTSFPEEEIGEFSAAQVSKFVLLCI